QSEIFSSTSLHEYDGVFDLTLNWPVPGKYTFALTAKKGTWSDSAAVDYTIADTVPPVNIGAAPTMMETFVGGLGNLRAGHQAQLTFANKDLTGQLVPHSEIDFSIRRGDVPLLWNKIHTHSSGTFDVRVNLTQP